MPIKDNSSTVNQFALQSSYELRISCHCPHLWERHSVDTPWLPFVCTQAGELSSVSANADGRRAAASRESFLYLLSLLSRVHTDTGFTVRVSKIDWLNSVLRPLQHSIGYMGDGFYRSKDPTNSVKVLKEKAVKENNTKKHKENRKYTHTK